MITKIKTLLIFPLVIAGISFKSLAQYKKAAKSETTEKSAITEKSLKSVTSLKPLKGIKLFTPTKKAMSINIHMPAFNDDNPTGGGVLDPTSPDLRDIPNNFFQRNYINVTNSYDLQTIPGTVVHADKATGKIELYSLQAFIKDNITLKIDEIPSNIGMHFKHTLSKGKSGNGSIAFGGFSASNDEIYSVIIQDVAKCALPYSQIDITGLKEYIKRFGGKLDDYYIINNVILTTIVATKSVKTKFDAKINATFVTLGGETYKSDDEFKQTRLISVDLRSLASL